MNVEVRFFASLREAAGVGSLELSLPERSGIDGLLAALATRLPPDALAALQAENVRIACNQNLVALPVTLADGDEVAFLPPVTGG